MTYRDRQKSCSCIRCGLPVWERNTICYDCRSTMSRAEVAKWDVSNRRKATPSTSPA